MYSHRFDSANRETASLTQIRATGVGLCVCPIGVEQAQIQLERQQARAARLSWEAGKG